MDRDPPAPLDASPEPPTAERERSTAGDPGLEDMQPASTPDPRAPASPPQPSSPSSALRRAILRGLLAGLAGAGTCALLGYAFEVVLGVGYLALQGFFGGGVLGAVGLLESVGWGAAGSPPPRRLLAFSAAVWALTTVLGYGALLQSVYLSEVLAGRGNASASRAVENELLYTLNDPAPLVAVLLLVGLAFALTSLSRGCELRVPEAAALCSLGALPPAIAVLFGTPLCTELIDPRFVFGAVAAGTALLPAANWLGDAVERRVFGVAPPASERRRPLAWTVAAACLTLGSLGGYALARGLATARERYEAEYYALLGEAQHARYTNDHATVYRACQSMRALSLGVLDAREVRDLWLEAAWWTGRPGPSELSRDERERLALWSTDPHTRAVRGDLRLRRGDLEGAWEDFSAAAKAADFGPDPWVHLGLAEVLVARGELAGAEAELTLAEQAGAEPQALARVRRLLAR